MSPQFSRQFVDEEGSAPLGLLVARCVEKGKAGRPPGNRRDRDDSEKVSAQAFAKASGTTADRVLRYLSAWEKAADRLRHLAA